MTRTSKERKQPVPQLPGSLNKLSARLSPQVETMLVRAEYELRPQTIHVCAYMAQWKHMLQALTIDWLKRTGGDEHDAVFLSTICPLMWVLTPYENRLKQRGQFLYRKQTQIERKYNIDPVEKKSLALIFTPLEWRQLYLQLVMIVLGGNTYIYPDVLERLYLECQTTLDTLNRVEETHFYLDDEGNPHYRRFFLTLRIDTGYTQDEIPALYRLPFKRWRKRTRSHGRHGRNHTPRRNVA